MACPFFMPVSKLEDGRWPHPGRLPLGCGWAGYCTVPGHEGESLQGEELRSCNLGYAETCRRIPRDRAWDAVRFGVKSNLPPSGRAGAGNKASNAGRVIEIQYVCERQHRPGEHGTLVFDASAVKWLRPHLDARMQKMAECFLASHFERNRFQSSNALENPA